MMVPATATPGPIADQVSGALGQESPVLEMEHVSKAFGATQALDDVSLALQRGEIHALLGENGAGKSTLIKIFTGIQQPDSGEIRVDGVPIQVSSPQDAQRFGVAAIYQEPMIFPDLSVAENIFIGHRDRGKIVDRRRMEREAEEVLARLDVHLDVGEPARGLTLAEQQTVEIAKAISLDVRVLIMDEPTASLSAHEVRRLFRIVANLRQQGVAILFISHRMEEVFEIADRVTILRDGRWISTTPRAELTPASAIRQMVGREVKELFRRQRREPGAVRLEARQLSREGVFQDVSFDLRAGEVLGFAGLVGARRTDVGLALFGIAPADRGEIRLDGQHVAIASPRDAMARGIAYSTEDRRQLGLVMPLSIAANISLPSLPRFLSPNGLVRRTAERDAAEGFRQRLSIRAPSVETPTAALSGGNQQKVVISKWLETKPKVLILDEPTRGIDVGAKVEVHQLIDDLAAEGMAIILISSDLPEVLAMSDRILVMREGRQMAIFDHDDATQERVLTAAMGQSDDLFGDEPGIDLEAGSDAVALIDRLIAGDEPDTEGRP
ncbi:MAG: transporter related [Thermomicrobiales bacterium]|jgi:rhamnose transport system ATP-binding protein|nr:transporter related [Thermomicrobiales bacterium]MDF3038456.1 transporter related [Thermomicrobiales bacterium]